LALVATTALLVGQKDGGKWQKKHTETTVYHEYKTSTDYNRMWDLLHEGRSLIRLEYNNSGRFDVMEVHRKVYTDGESVIYGMGTMSSKDFTNISKEDFIKYCEWKKLMFLDQI
jgi:hypothetical protein